MKQIEIINQIGSLHNFNKKVNEFIASTTNIISIEFNTVLKSHSRILIHSVMIGYDTDIIEEKAVKDLTLLSVRMAEVKLPKQVISILTDEYMYRTRSEKVRYPPFKYVEEITERGFLKLYMAGRKNWEALVEAMPELKNKY